MIAKNLGVVFVKMMTTGMLLGALGRQQYSYYTALRWVVCAVAAFSAFRALELRKVGWAWMFSVVTAFFNPIIPVHLSRDTWAFIDGGVAIVFLISIFVIDRKVSPP